jgi:hypothetical protein
LEQSFVNPPASAKPHTWWHWMNGNITKEGITADLEAMAEAGIGGAQIFNAEESIPHGSIQFNSPEWIDMVKHAVSEAKRLGLELCIHNCGGWSSSGGPWNTPEHGMKIVVTSEIQIKGPTKLSSIPPQPEAKLDFYRDIAVLAFPATAVDPQQSIPNLNGKIFLDRVENLRIGNRTDNLPETLIQQNTLVDLTDKFLSSDGKTGVWEVPEGEWTILRIGYTVNGRKNHPAPPEGTGLECDKLSKEAVKAHWDGHIALILDAIGKTYPDQSGLNNVLIDSYEVGTQNWTQGFEKEFEKRCGYSILKFLPVFTGRVVDAPEITERFLWDFRRVVADMFAENYSEYFGKLAHEAGLLYSSEPYGNCPSDDIQYGSYCDIPMGEFWQGSGESVNPGNAKLPSSIAHVYGKKFVGAEAFTAAPDGGKWTKDPFALKAQGDIAYCGGINRMIYHRYAHQPWTNPTRYPGMTMGQWGTHFERTLTWWSQTKEWLTYQARCQYMLQEGLFVADVLFYNGEDAPCGLPSINLPKGYDYDGCDTKALKLLKVKNGRLVLPSGMSYRILVLPEIPAMSPETLTEIGRLANEGATIIGRVKPESAQGLRKYPESDGIVKKLADEVWSKIISDKSPVEVLKSIDLKPDFKAPDNAKLTYIHREIGGMDVYFVASPDQRSGEVKCTFRISGKTPELWCPETGAIETAPIFEEKDGLTTLPIRFEPSGSVFVVFRKPVSGDHAVDVKYTTIPQKSAIIGDLKIVKAEYGYFADENINNCIDVKNLIRKELASGKKKINATNDQMGGDPAGGTVKELMIEYLIGGVKKREQVKENQSVTLPEGAKVLKAYYGLISGEVDVERIPKIVDVTAKIKGLVKDGMVNTVVNDVLVDGKNPAETNELRVEYLFNDKPDWANVSEKQILHLPLVSVSETWAPVYEIKVAADGNPEIQAWKPGTLEVTMASGKTIKKEIETVPETIEIDGPWQLSFPPNWGAPEQITLDKLISWTEHSDAGVKYFSGTAVYIKSFKLKEKPEAGLRLILDLGNLKNFAEVELNGKSLPLLWKPPYRLDITDAVQAGNNALRIKVTNLWPNRVIGDEFLPEDLEWKGKSLKAWPQWLLDGKPSPTGRLTFTTWHHWTKEDEPLPSGLFGPVLVRQIKCYKVN